VKKCRHVLQHESGTNTDEKKGYHSSILKLQDHFYDWQIRMINRKKKRLVDLAEERRMSLQLQASHSVHHHHHSTTSREVDYDYEAAKKDHAQLKDWIEECMLKAQKEDPKCDQLNKCDHSHARSIEFHLPREAHSIARSPCINHNGGCNKCPLKFDLTYARVLFDGYTAWSELHAFEEKYYTYLQSMIKLQEYMAESGSRFLSWEGLEQYFWGTPVSRERLTESQASRPLP